MPAPKQVTVRHRTDGDNEVFEFTVVTPGDRSFTISRAEQNPDGAKTLAQMAGAAWEALRPAIEARVGELDGAFGAAGALFVPPADGEPPVLTPLDAPVPSVDALQAQLAAIDAKVAETRAQLVAAVAEVDPALAEQVGALIDQAAREVQGG
jgi:hypothetical protein